MSGTSPELRGPGPRRQEHVFSAEDLTVFGRPSSVNCQKVLWALEETGMPFNLRFSSAMLGPGDTPSRQERPLDSGALKRDVEYLKKNPAGMIPSLVVRGAALTEDAAAWTAQDSIAISESNTIVRYLWRRFWFRTYGLGRDAFLAKYQRGPLDSPDGATDQTPLEVQALCEAWMDRQNGLWMAPDMQPVVVIIDEVSRKEAKDRDSEALKRALRGFAAHEHTRMLERQLAESPFLAGSSFTVADIPFGAICCRFYVGLAAAEARGIWVPGPSGGDERQATPHLDAWFGRLLERDAFRLGAYDPERIHAGLRPTRPLPAWHRRYLESNELEVPEPGAR